MKIASPKQRAHIHKLWMCIEVDGTQRFTKIYRNGRGIALPINSHSEKPAASRILDAPTALGMSNSIAHSAIVIRDLETIPDIEAMLRLEKEVWGLDDADVSPLTSVIALKAAGSILLGAFEGGQLVGFALAFPSFEYGKVGVHSHMLAVHPSHREYGLGYRLKLAQRERALAMGISEMTWTFDPLRSLNAHLNFSKLGVISDSYRVNFYGPQTSSPFHTNGTDRLWVTWRMAEARVQQRLNGKDGSAEVLDALRHLEPVVRFNGDGKPTEGDLAASLSRQRIAIEIPGDMDRIEHTDKELAHGWRLATRRAFTQALAAEFVVKEFCRSIRGQQGPGAYLLERRNE
jgi:predicted GNAT superfamily acetyltransferase